MGSRVVFSVWCLRSGFKSLAPFRSEWKMRLVFLQEPNKVLFKKLSIFQGGISDELSNLACHRE